MCRAPVPASRERPHDLSTLPTGPSMHLSADGWGQAEAAGQEKWVCLFPSGPCVLCVFMRPYVEASTVNDDLCSCEAMFVYISCTHLDLEVG